MQHAPHVRPQTAFFILLAGLTVIFTGCQSSNTQSVAVPAGLFRESGYDDAVELSKTENKPLFLLFDGDWAKDRAKLFSHTLANPTLAQLIRERTVALHIDVIDQAEIAKNHHVTDVPLLILISPEGREISRWFGAPKPTSFTEELGALLSGKSALQIKQGKIKPSDLVGRNRIAAALIADGQYEKARAELLWLYNTGIGPDVMVHKKLSTKQVIDNLVFLGGQHPPSVEIIANLREQERLRIVRSPANVMAARKLAALLQVKEDLDATLAIFNTLPAGPAREYVKINIVGVNTLAEKISPKPPTCSRSNKPSRKPRKVTK